MMTTTGKTRCVICSKEKATLKCGGCAQDFCYNHWDHHQQQLNTQLEEIEINRDLFRQSLTQQIEQPNNPTLIQQINQWELKSIKTIQQTAEEARQIVLKSSNAYHHRVEVRLNELTNEIRESRQENDFNEINMRHFQEQLDRLTKDLAKPTSISIRKDSTSLINNISVYVSDTSDILIPNEPVIRSNIHQNTKWIQNGVTVAGGNGQGNALNQLNDPVGIFVDDDQTIYIVDSGNHRIMEWKRGATNGRVVAGDNGRGNSANQLNCPRDVVLDKERNNMIICDRDNRRVVQWPLRNGTRGETIISDINCGRLAIDNDGYLYVSDYKKHEVRRWNIGDTNGVLVAGGNHEGNGLNQLNQPTFVFVDENQSVYVTDWGNDRVMKWVKDAREGILVAGGRGKRNDLAQLFEPRGVIADHLGVVYVCDSGNHRIMRWYQRYREPDIVVGRDGQGKRANQLTFPFGLLFDRQGNLYVVDSGNHRVQRFDIEQNWN